MKKYITILAVAFYAMFATAQTNQYFWYNGNLMMGNPIAQIDSVTFGEGEPTDTLHILLPPSKWLLEVRFLYSHIGHGVDGERSAGGSGIISICVTLFAPWRIAVPRQSLPVSPPPIMRTFLSFAEISRELFSRSK